MFENGFDAFTTVIVICIVVIILGVMLPYSVAMLFRRKRIHAEEKNLLTINFEAELLKSQIEVQEQTMQNIAEELHDNIGQLLSLTSSTLSSINSKNDKIIDEKVKTSRELVNKSIQELRDLARIIHGEQIATKGIAYIVEQELQRLKKIDIYKVKVSNKLTLIGQSSPKKDLFILRVLQELINNVIKHAKATEIEFTMYQKGSLVHLIISDNGIGFNETNTKSEGLGLISIRKRVRLIDGNISIQNPESGGTIISIEFPYP